MNEIAVIHPDGRKGYIPVENIGKALARGYILSNPEETIAVTHPDGRKGYIPARNINKALERGFNLRTGEILDISPEKQSDLEVAAKGAISGLAGLADIPQAIGSIGLNPEYGLFGMGRKAYNAITGTRHEPLKNIASELISALPLASSKIKEGIKDYTGIDLEPHPSNTKQRIIKNATEWAVPGGLLGKFATKGSKLLSEAAKAGTIGASSGILQEGGINPLVADIGSAITLPLVGQLGRKAATGTKNLLSAFTPAGRQENLNLQAANILKERVGPENVPNIIAKLNNQFPLAAKPVTAELAENVGLAKLHQAMSPNISSIAEKEALNDAIIRNKLGKLSSTIGTSSETKGNIIRNDLFNKLQQRKNLRSQITEPLYKQVEGLKEGVNLPNTKEFLKQEKRFAKGDISETLNYIENLTRNNQINKKQIEQINKLYDNLSPRAKEQIIQQVSQNPLPAELDNVLKNISGRLGEANRTGNKEKARILALGKENIEKDLQTVPEVANARSEYARLSKPVSAIEKEPLLNKFVKKDEFSKDFVISPELISEKILSGTLNNTKALINQIKDSPKALNAVRGVFIDKLLSSTELAKSHIPTIMGTEPQQALSYFKINNFIKKNKEKLSLVFEPEQVKIIEDAREILKRRNMANTLGRAVGSNTQSETTLLNNLFNKASNKVIREGIAYAIPGGGYIYDTIKDYIAKSRNQAIQEILESALSDPKIAKMLLTKVQDIKSPQMMDSIITKIFNPKVTYPVMYNELTRNQ